MPIHADRPMPILIGNDYEHVMAKVVVEEEPGKTVVTIVAVAEGAASEYLASILTATEPVALSFTGIPVRPRTKHSKEI